MRDAALGPGERHPRSVYFTIRVWAEDVDQDQVEWRGRVQHVLTGESIYFRTWNNLIAFMVKAAALHGSRQP